MANPYINQQEQTLYESFVANSKALEDQKLEAEKDRLRKSYFNSLDAVLDNSVDPRIKHSQRRFLGDSVSYDREDVNGRLVNVGYVDDVSKYRDNAAGYYNPNGDYIVASKGTPLIKGSVETAQATLSHERGHASRATRPDYNYDSSKRWEDRNEEVYAEQNSLQEFKDRLKVMGVEYTHEMGMRFLVDIYNDGTAASSKAPLRGMSANYQNTIPGDTPLNLYTPDNNDVLGRYKETPLPEPQNRLKDIIDQREAFYSGNRLPPLEVFANGYKDETDSYRQPLMSAQIVYGTHPLLQGK